MKAPERTNDPAFWRQRADEARRMVDQLSDPAEQQAMREVAASYDKLAKLAEEGPLKQG